MLNKIIVKFFKTAVATAFCILILQQLFSFSSNLYAQNETSKFELVLTTPKSEYIQLEPVQFIFDLRNKTNQAVRWDGVLMLGSDIDFIVQPINGEEIRLEGRKMTLNDYASIPTVLQANDKFQSKVILNGIEQLEKMLPSAGVYQVKVEFRYREIEGENKREKKILSNPITIKVNAPQGINQAAYNYLKNEYENVNRSRITNNELINRRESFINTYRESVYAKYEILKLAYSYRAVGEDNKALRELCKISSDEDFYYARRVKILLHQIDAKLNPPDMRELPPNVPMPVRQDPCLRVQN